jgi:hypothetical protein
MYFQKQFNIKRLKTMTVADESSKLISPLNNLKRSSIGNVNINININNRNQPETYYVFSKSPQSKKLESTMNDEIVRRYFL